METQTKRIEMLNARLDAVSRRLPAVASWAARRERERAETIRAGRAFAAEERTAGLALALRRLEETGAALDRADRTAGALPGALEGRRRGLLARTAGVLETGLGALRTPDCGPWLASLAALGARLDRMESRLRALPPRLGRLRRYTVVDNQVRELAN